jgi:flagellar biosynthetic protein FlhB
MLADVARADVVIVNPTHYAVALEWKRGSGRAPVCLAKGTDEVAARIRERARDNKVPIFSDPPCARAIHATVEVGEEIRREQFAAVAAAIRFAEKMREKARAGW